ncbi:HK97-gp10 family putative phage morphogenesis protein [Tropicimonas isoalkanivorans]|uniref:Phage protein, HK97 gp10 family n=1 Tax=Tropicimonas isoalkanivorans TaxID=441112 RepID=A0A1I1EBB2_9RHOB|nr:HK97-gp10 family putative phage morphogenesis protein [Tropicimonas isoalkanivorans]SFB82300.1 phage protein, HK97 gp10 family [Tropicimonas isoalkanivorans]
MGDGGLSKFQKRMNAIPKEVREAVKPALMKSAEETAAAMRTLAPVDSGDLRDSIAVTGPGQATPPYSQPGGSYTVPENAVSITAGNTDVRYAHLAEYGTKDTAAQAYFWPGFRLHRKRSLNRIKRAISKAVREAGK